jgi:hypothetical protein
VPYSGFVKTAAYTIFSASFEKNDVKLRLENWVEK